MSNHERTGIDQRLAIHLDHGSDVPLYRQIVDHVWLGAVEGILEPGERLPTVRQLAIDLSVHPNTVARAYSELTLLGIVSPLRGEGTFVCLTPPDKPELERREQLERLCSELMSRIQALGFSLDELIDTLGELRTEGARAKGRSQ